MRRKIPRILLTLLMGCLLAAGWTAAAMAEPLSTGDELWLISEEQLAELEALPKEEETVYIPEEDLGTPIETPYITLYYPSLYEEHAVIDLAVGEECCTVSLLTTLEERELKLFTMTLSKAPAEGFKLGMLNDVGVYMLMHEQKAEDWSPESFLRINELQESVNALLVQIYDHEGFMAGQ